MPEPFGQVIVQGMARGRIVVAADSGGPAEVITVRPGRPALPDGRRGRPHADPGAGGGGRARSSPRSGRTRSAARGVPPRTDGGAAARRPRPGGRPDLGGRAGPESAYSARCAASRPVAPAAHRHPAQPDRFLARSPDRSARGPARRSGRAADPAAAAVPARARHLDDVLRRAHRVLDQPAEPGVLGASATGRRSGPTSCGCSPRTRSPRGPRLARRAATAGPARRAGAQPARGVRRLPRARLLPPARRAPACGCRAPSSVRPTSGSRRWSTRPPASRRPARSSASTTARGPASGAAVAHDSRGADGRYRRYRAFVLGDLVLPEDVIVADHWNASLRHLVTVERNYALTELERRQLLLINSTLGLDFSCVDYLRERDTGHRCSTTSTSTRRSWAPGRATCRRGTTAAGTSSTTATASA